MKKKEKGQSSIHRFWFGICVFCPFNNDYCFLDWKLWRHGLPSVIQLLYFFFFGGWGILKYLLLEVYFWWHLAKPLKSSVLTVFEVAWFWVYLFYKKACIALDSLSGYAIGDWGCLCLGLSCSKLGAMLGEREKTLEVVLRLELQKTFVWMPRLCC